MTVYDYPNHYLKAQEVQDRLHHHLAQPENRIKYALSWLSQFGDGAHAQAQVKLYEAISEAVDGEAHY